MLKYCLEKWNNYKDVLEAALRTDDTLYNCDYGYLVGLVVKHILNNGVDDYRWSEDGITVIDDGDYQGTLLFLIPQKTYQPSEYEYLMTYIGYGSCSVCDYLQSIQPWEKRTLNDNEVGYYMSLCKDLITNMVKPYNGGWREDERFTVVTMEEK